MILARDNLPLPKCPPAHANKLAAQLIGLCPLHEGLTPGMASGAITAILAEYPVDVAEQICHPVHGIPRKMKWGLKLADVDEAAEVIMKRKATIVAGAQGVIREDARRKQEAADYRAPPTAAEIERRKALIASLGLNKIPRDAMPARRMTNAEVQADIEANKLRRGEIG